MDIKTAELIIIGAGPGGYEAALYAAQNGTHVTLVDKEENLGGVCLLRGCIPSKAYLHATEVLEEAQAAKSWGIQFGMPEIDIHKMRTWKDQLVQQLAKGIDSMVRNQNIDLIHGRVVFENSSRLRVETDEGQTYYEFEQAIIATGSQPALPDNLNIGNPRVMTSREALELEEIPEQLLVIGGGYIGMELGTVYGRLGSSVTLVEALDTVLPQADSDLVKPVQEATENLFHQIRLNSKVSEVATSGKRLKVTIETNEKSQTAEYDRILVAVGRIPNSKGIGLETTEVTIDDNGFVETDEEQRTSVKNIFAIGDVTDGEQLAHRATREALRAVRALSGDVVMEEPIRVPAVVYTNPEIAWIGLTEKEAKNQERKVRTARQQWNHLGRAHSINAADGVTKLVFDAESERLLGVGIAGKNAGELISEGVLAIEMAATAYDIVHAIHPHPTLSESFQKAAGKFYMNERDE